MCKILCIGDPHFTSSNTRETDALMTEIIHLIQEHDIKHTIILGDTLDRHETVNLHVLYRVKLFFESITGLGSQLYVLIGNHDIPNNKLFMSEIHPFMAWSHITVVAKTKVIEIEGIRFLFVPYVPPGRFNEAISTVEDLSSIRCIFAHQEFKGCTYSSTGGTSQTGDYYTLPIDIISGHIHEKQRLDRIYYPGTPYQTNMGESQDKTVSIFTWSDQAQSYIEQMYTLNIPKKITLNMDTTQIRTWSPSNTIDRYRIILHGSNAEFIALSKQGLIKQLTSKGIKVVFKDNEKTSQPIIQREKISFLEGIRREIQKLEPSIIPYVNALSIQLFGQ